MTEDLQKGLYSPAYVNFLSSLPRVLLEEFASQTAEAGTSEKIAQLFDQYLNFIVSEPDLFSLGMQNEHTYWALNSAKTSDAELDAVVDRIVSGLFSVVVTMGKSATIESNATDLMLIACYFRCHSHHSLSQGCCCRNGCGTPRP
jgi:hypothetical protein